jgi:hypothetical protein
MVKGKVMPDEVGEVISFVSLIMKTLAFLSQQHGFLADTAGVSSTLAF